MNRPVVIGIAGGSGSGKTTVIKRIVDGLEPSSIALIEHDAYYRDLRHLSTEQRKAVNFDHPDALETELLLAHLQQLLAGETIQKPTYDYNAHRRLPETIDIPSRPVIILDGILVLAESRLADLMDIKLFVDTDGDVRLLRRIRRDLRERGRTIEDILNQYERTVPSDVPPVRRTVETKSRCNHSPGRSQPGRDRNGAFPHQISASLRDSALSL